MNLSLAPGFYYAGINRPWFVSEAAVREALAKYGATEVIFYRREQPPPVNPYSDPTATDNWDEWVRVAYPGEPQVIDTPRHWAWLVHVPAEADELPEVVSHSPVPANAYWPIGFVPLSAYGGRP